MNKLILGYFGYNNNQIDGQTIKTRNIYNLFKSEYNNVIYFDTQDLKSSKLSYVILLYKILISKDIILLPGQNNLTRLLPFLIKFKIIFNKRIFLFAVGGWLGGFINKNNFDYFKKIDYYFVESNRLKNEILRFGFNNVTVFPNFRIHKFQPTISINNLNELKLIFVARITPEKGCNFILDFAQHYSENKQNFTKNIIIDFYGPLNSEYELEFKEKLNKFDFVNYKGFIDSNSIFNVISKYDISILPTYYHGEGFPGTIVDSYISGVPMIVSNWKDLPEFVDNNKTGFILNTNSIEELILIINQIQDDSFLFFLKKNSLEKSKDYSYEKALNIIKAKIY